jgi:hypothetical protein
MSFDKSPEEQVPEGSQRRSCGSSTVPENPYQKGNQEGNSVKNSEESAITSDYLAWKSF